MPRATEDWGLYCAEESVKEAEQWARSASFGPQLALCPISGDREEGTRPL